nr:transposase, mutator type [Tanacetum cinerariifolium]
STEVTVEVLEMHVADGKNAVTSFTAELMLVRSKWTRLLKVDSIGYAMSKYLFSKQLGPFPSVFCLKINHDGAFTPPPKIRYKGGKDGDYDSGSKGVVSSGSKGKDQFKEKGQVSGSKGKSNNKTKAGEGISKQKVFRAKKMAQERVEGNHTRQYAQLRDYCLELKNSNPNTTTKIEVEPLEDINSTERKFKRVYVCLGHLKDGFKVGKRDLLGLDGCFLSGSYPGWILTAVRVDPNNGIYPFAYAIVKSENKDSWKWFLECVGDDLYLFINSNFTFISDRQKGIIPAIAESFPIVEHRFCLKHIYDNMKLSWRGQLYKEMLWRCATSHMEKLKDFNKDAYEWLKKIPPQHWSRSHFSGRAHCDVLLNNMCEVFNRQLVDGRDKPIITCLEFIREYLMKRIVNVQKVISKSDSPLTPNATKVFNIIMKEAGQMKVHSFKCLIYKLTEIIGVLSYSN